MAIANGISRLIENRINVELLDESREFDQVLIVSQNLRLLALGFGAFAFGLFGYIRSGLQGLLDLFDRGYFFIGLNGIGLSRCLLAPSSGHLFAISFQVSVGSAWLNGFNFSIKQVHLAPTFLFINNKYYYSITEHEKIRCRYFK